MFGREQLRMYLIGLLKSEDVIQGPDCETGKIHQNCSGKAPIVFDSSDFKILDDYDPSWVPSQQDVVFNVAILENRMTLDAGSHLSSTIRPVVSIVHTNENGHKSQNVLDKIFQRFVYRLMSTPSVFSKDGSQEFRGPIRLAEDGMVSFTVQDEMSSIHGQTTARHVSLELRLTECIHLGNCASKPLCFDFALLKPGVSSDRNSDLHQ